ncbi:hypothetical protein J6590_029710 [Homalodisca vitripennis]|nr:hypothetical protein J6590_029710 [Homalodisca vitripennis]
MFADIGVLSDQAEHKLSSSPGCLGAPCFRVQQADMTVSPLPDLTLEHYDPYCQAYNHCQRLQFCGRGQCDQTLVWSDMEWMIVVLVVSNLVVFCVAAKHMMKPGRKESRDEERKAVIMYKLKRLTR